MLSAVCIASSVGCYPVYPPSGYYNSGGYNQDSKGESVPQESRPQRQPVGYAVDPALAIAGVAAAGILG